MRTTRTSYPRCGAVLLRALRQSGPRFCSAETSSPPASPPAFPQALFRVQPRWADEAHFTSALSSLSSTLSNLDVDLAENVFPGSVYKFQYGGYQLSEILAPFLDKFTFSSVQDQQRVLQLAFLLDKKFVLRAFDNSLTADVLASRFADISSGDGGPTLCEDVSGGTALAPATAPAKDSALAECLSARHYAGALPLTAENRNPDSLGAWASAECDAYLTAVRKTCNVCFVENPSPTGTLPSRVLVSTTDIAAGVRLVYADGLSAHMERMRGVAYDTKEEEILLQKVHEKFLPRERHVMGSSGMLERIAVSAF